MGAFEYEALDTAGRRRKGVISADTARLARRALKRKRLVPVRLEAAEMRSESGRGPGLRRERVRPRETALITRQLATLLSAGAPVEEAVQTLAFQSERAAVRRTLLGLRSGVMEGRRLSDAMAAYPQAFPPFYRAMVAAAEGTGALDRVLERLADYLERNQAMRGKMANALVYPAALAVTAAGVVAALMVFVVPKVVEQFAAMDQSLPALTQAVIAVSAFLANAWPLLLVALAAAIAGAAAAMRRESGRRKMEYLALRLPIAGRLLRAVNAARMARTLSVLVGAGVPVVEGLNAAQTTMRSVLLREALATVAGQVREGSSLAGALRRCEAFPPLVVYMAAVGERSGRLGEMLEKAADHLEADFESATQTAVALLEPAIIVAMGAIVGLIVLAILLPILQLNTMTVM